MCLMGEKSLMFSYYHVSCIFFVMKSVLLYRRLVQMNLRSTSLDFMKT